MSDQQPASGSHRHSQNPVSRTGRVLSQPLTFSQIPGSGDTQVLNYALLLEDFEAALYQAALSRLTGLGLSAGDATYGNLFTYFQKFSQVEAAHAGFLRAALGSNAIGLYTYNFGLSAATALDVLNLVLQVEATGTRAYLGAIPRLTSQSPYLQIAAAIQGTEARHTTILTILRNALEPNDLVPTVPQFNDLAGNSSDLHYSNGKLYSTNSPNEGYNGIEVNLTPEEVLSAISPYFASPA